MRRSLIAVVALALVAVPARAAGPPVRGGEDPVRYEVPRVRNREVDIRVAYGTDRITWMFLQAPGAVRCTKSRTDAVGLWQTPFRVGPTRRWTKRVAMSTGKGDFERWTLRFSANWERLTVTYTTHYHGNYRGYCKGTARFSVARKHPAASWPLTHFTGTTSQGLPIAFDATRSKGDFIVLNTRVSASLTCDDEQTRTFDFAQSTAHDYEGWVEGEGKFSMTLEPGGFELDGVLGERATGRLEGWGSADPDGVNCVIPDGLTFSASPVSG